MTESNPLSFRSIALRAMISHTITYFLAGILAFNLFDYAGRFAEPPLSLLMRPADDPMVMAGVLFQPVRGLLFGIVFYLLRGSLFRDNRGWLVAWVMLVIVGIISTFGPSPGSIEGMIYTKIPLFTQLGGLIEVVVQSLALSVLTFYWVRNPHLMWLNWGLGILFVLLLLFPVLGLLVGPEAAGR